MSYYIRFLLYYIISHYVMFSYIFIPLHVMLY